ncbi:GNPTAB [Symbiodinium microadriaticum]|nr:GNPTAB [Symbiodinium microadriaticum]
MKNVDWPATHKMESDKDISFEMIGDNITNTLDQLNSIRYRKTKFVCVNDQMTDPSSELQRILKDFFLSFFPFPSQFELPSTKQNPTLYYDEYMQRYSTQISTYHRLSYLFGACLDRVRSGFVYAYDHTWRSFVRELYDFTEGTVQPKSALDVWAEKGNPRRHSQKRPTSVTTIETNRNGLRVFLPYWVLVWCALGMICLTCLRQRTRRDSSAPISSRGEFMDASQTRSRTATDVESRLYLEGLLGRSAAVEHERKRYYGESSASDKGGGDDMLNFLWKTIGYGESGTKGTPPATSLRSISQDTDDSGAGECLPQKDDDEVSVSTLGMDGIDDSPTKEAARKKTAKSVRFGAVSTVGDKENSVSVTKIFRGFKGKMQESLHMKTS